MFPIDRVFSLLSALLIGAAFASWAGPVRADEKKLRQKIIQKLGTNVPIEAITKTPYGGKAVAGGLYEVYMNGRLHYTDENFSFMVVGALIDTQTNENYSENQMRQHASIDLSLLPPLKNAIKNNVGNGKKTAYVFSDPLCRHCQDIEKYLSDYPDLTTYVFLTPNERINPGANAMAKAIWCSANPARAYNDYMRQGRIPDNRTNQDCVTPFRENTDIATQLGFSGTPGLIFGDGFLVNGAPSPQQLKNMIAKTPK